MSRCASRRRRRCSRPRPAPTSSRPLSAGSTILADDGMDAHRRYRAPSIANIRDFKTEVLVASIRHPMHVVEAAKLGAHVGTMPPDVCASSSASADRQGARGLPRRLEEDRPVDPAASEGRRRMSDQAQPAVAPAAESAPARRRDVAPISRRIPISCCAIPIFFGADAARVAARQPVVDMQQLHAAAPARRDRASSRRSTAS